MLFHHPSLYFFGMKHAEPLEDATAVSPCLDDMPMVCYNENKYATKKK